MFYCLRGHGRGYEVQTVCQAFVPDDGNTRYWRLTEPPDDGFCAVSALKDGAVFAEIRDGGRIVGVGRSDVGGGEKGLKAAVKRSLYDAFLDCGFPQKPWGVLTGIRPAKLALELLRGGAERLSVVETLEREYLVERGKAKLCADVAGREMGVLDKYERGGGAVFYVNVPFCASRCFYCSFTSSPVERYLAMMPEYFAAFETELKIKAARLGGVKVGALYIGGGTPVCLPLGWLEKLLALVDKYVPRLKNAEYTLEAGRPDVIDREKLAPARAFGVNRVSVNPQSLNDLTLERVGRRHNSARFFAAFETARMAGFDNINCDLILGLPGEGVADVERTLDGVLSLSPEGLTAHVLYIKRAADFSHKGGDFSGSDIGRMVDLAAERCKSAGLRPYYMYRQKNQLGGLENVGYAADGFECAYNVIIMEETRSIIAAGAGASTKVVSSNGGEVLITREFNPKGIEEYIRKYEGNGAHEE